MATRPVPDEVILGLLKVKPSYGYDLLEKFRSKEDLGRIWCLSTSQLYAVLRRLEKGGAIRGKQIRVQDAPDRREYSIQPEGAEQLERWLKTPKPSASLHRIRVLFLSRLYIAMVLGRSTESIVDNQINVCQLQLEEFHRERQNAVSAIESLTLDFLNNQLSSAISWLQQCKIRLENEEQKTKRNTETKALN